MATEKLAVKWMPTTALTPHPRNYRSHPADQIEHLMRSIEEFGFYRNIVICNGNIILAGHGVVEAAAKLGREVPTVSVALDADEPRALKLLALDNHVSHLAEDDDRMLTEMLKEIQQADDLMGTGFDEISLAALMMITRTAAEVRDFNAAAEWAGLPEFQGVRVGPKIIIEFDDPEQRQRFFDQNEGLMITYRKNVDEEGFTMLWSCRWAEDPAESGREDPGSVIFEG